MDLTLGLVNVECCGMNMSEVATCRQRNAAALSSRVSVTILSPSVSVAQAWSHCWTYLFDVGDGMGQGSRCTWW